MRAQSLGVGDPVVWLRFAKLLGVLAFAAGTLAATLPLEIPLRSRRLFAATVCGPGFGVTWVCGFVLVAYTGHSFLSTWILGSMVLSLFSLQVVLFTVGREGRAGAKSCTLAILGVVATMMLMVFRPA